MKKTKDSGLHIKSTDKQSELLGLILSEKFRRGLFGGAVGGAKTFGILLVLIVLCRVYPGSRWAVIRKDRPVLKRNTLPSFWKVAPRPFFHPRNYNKQDMIAKATNGSEILFIAEDIKGDPEGSKFDGLEVNGAIIEEANECRKATYLKLVDRVNRWIMDVMPKGFILMSCNPHQGWLKEMFYLPYTSGTLPDDYFFLPSSIIDNPHLPQEYVESLEELKRIAPHLYRKRVKGSWEAEDDIQQLNSWEDVNACEPLIEFTPEEREREDFIRSMGVDVGRFGNDPSVWYVLEGYYKKGFNKIHRESYPKTSGPEVSNKTKELIIEYNIEHERVCVDSVGLGGEVCDFLEVDGYEVTQIVGGASSTPQEILGGFDFENFNDQMAWNVRILLRDRRIGGIDEEKLKQDLTVYKYDIKGEKKIDVWSKQKIKEKLGRSPDDGDSLKYGVWGAIFEDVSLLPGLEYA